MQYIWLLITSHLRLFNHFSDMYKRGVSFSENHRKSNNLIFCGKKINQQDSIMFNNLIKISKFWFINKFQCSTMAISIFFCFCLTLSLVIHSFSQTSASVMFHKIRSLKILPSTSEKLFTKSMNVAEKVFSLVFIFFVFSVYSALSVS